MRGIDSAEIESILQFIYLGEATFYQDRMNEFLDVARSLEVKEICKDLEIPNQQQDRHDIDLENVQPKTETVQEQIYITNKQSQLKKDDENKYPCYKCNYKASQSNNLQQHIRSIHEGVKYPCDQCDYQATHSSSLRQHIKSIHDGVRYPCDQCNYKSTCSKNLRQHKLRGHLEAS